MAKICPRCRSEVAAPAKFCGRCGMAQPMNGGQAGRVAEPGALQPPVGFAAVSEASDLHFSWSGAWGKQRLLGTEPVKLQIFNAGYSLRDVKLRVAGKAADASGVYQRQIEIEKLDKGETWSTEIPSYEILEPLVELTVVLVDAVFSWAD